MANHKSAEKRQRQNIKRRERNRAIRSSVRTETKKLVQAIEKGDANLDEQVKQTTSTINKAASKGVVKKQTASRKISRLMKKAHQTSTAPAKS